MTVLEAIVHRHSVRRYTDKKIEGETLDLLKNEIEECNRDGGLNIQLVTEEPTAFSGKLASYGNFSGVKNYIALVGKKAADLQERLGYYGEKIVLKAQQLGLNTCWVALSYNKKKAKVEIQKDEQLICVIAVGYGETSGTPHKNKLIDSVCKFYGDMPVWFMDGVQAAMLAPSAKNQQKFSFNLLSNSKVYAENKGGFYSKVDLGIAKYHFEIGAGKENFEFVKGI